MTYAQLKAFHAVAVTGGFSRAAVRLALTQPAVSDHVRKLEEAYGVQLFLRHKKGTELSDLGRKLLALTERQFEAEAQAHELLSRAQTLEEGELTVGADAAVHVLPLIARFKTRFPGIGVKLVSGNSAELAARLLDFSIDLAVAAEEPSSPLVQYLKLREDKMVAVASQKSPLARKRRIDLSALASLPLIMREEGSATRKLIMNEFQKRGLRPPAVTEIEGREAAREAVAQGLGVAVMPHSETMDDRRLARIRIVDWDEPMSEWLIWLSARADLHVIRSFLDMARKSVA